MSKSASTPMISGDITADSSMSQPQSTELLYTITKVNGTQTIALNSPPIYMNIEDMNRESSQVRWEKYIAQSNYKNQLEGIAVNLQTQTLNLQMLNTRIRRRIYIVSTSDNTNR